ncbi:MAG: hypothetical protein KGV44_13695 [Flavobacteriaceae bacterium]|nr:hypothetical protein [Flavobacteriaceae bacterium]
MSFWDKIFGKKEEEEKIDIVPPKVDVNLPLDQLFVSNFIKKEGKFLYCTSLVEVTDVLQNIIQENQWDEVICTDYDLLKLTKTVGVKSIPHFNSHMPVFVGCEYLIAENGSILFSSNQLKNNKISNLSSSFIVYATTSQIIRSNRDSLTGIKMKYESDIPNNISSIKSYNPLKAQEDFLNYGTDNAKNVYLILFEDL